MRQIGWNRGWALATLAVAGCPDDRETGFTGPAGVTATLTATAGDTTGGDTNDEAGPGQDSGKLDVPADTSSGPSNDESSGECASVSEESDVGLQPADIIFILDNSGSMDFEANAVQVNMNAFSSQIFLANIDAHVVVLSSLPGNGAGICIDPPLGGGMCPTDDNNPPGFTHLPVSIDSNNGLQILLQEFPNFANVMRPHASKHVVIVTDDNSDLGANDFVTMFNALDPANIGFKFHGIVADANPGFSCLQEPPHPCCVTAAAAGTVYLQLIDQTGGVFGSLCEQTFQPIFDQLAMAVVAGATLSCEFEIPPPPEGETFDANKVNVEFDDGNGNLLEIGRVDSAADCMNVTDGWYYDNPADPQTILVCPQTCEKIQGFDGATISIQFGCETVIAPPIG
jgi:hypothetical protein